MHHPLMHDEAMFASIPKGWLAGQGWGGHYDEFIPFNPDVSTGPTLLIPVGILIALFGNFAAAPMLTAALSHLLLLGLLLWRLQTLSKLGPGLLITVLAGVLTLDIRELISFSGNTTTVLLILLAASIIMDRALSIQRRFFLFGLLAGLALYAKVLSLLALMAMGSTALLLSPRDWHSTTRHIAYLLLGAGTILLPWQILKALALGQAPDALLALRSDYGRLFFFYHGSGIGNLLDAGDRGHFFLTSIARNARMMPSFLQSMLPIPAWLTVASVFFCSLWNVWSTWRKPEPFNQMLCLLAAGCLMHMIWFIGFNTAFNAGKSLFGVVLGLFMLGLTLIHRFSHVPRSMIAVIMLVLAVLPQAPTVSAFLMFKPGEHDTAFKTAMQETLGEIHKLPAHLPKTGCGYSIVSRRLEYLWPEPGLFRDCYNLIEDSLDFDESAYRQKYPDVAAGIVQGEWDSGIEHYYRQGWRENRQSRFLWRNVPEFYFVVDVAVAAYVGPHSPAAVMVYEACKDNNLFNNGFFLILHCTPESLQQHLDANAFMRHLIESHTWYRTRLRAL